MKKEVQIYLRHRPDRSISIEERHQQIMQKMIRIDPPLGFSAITPPIAPDCGDGLLAASFISHGIKGLQCYLMYNYRGEKYVWRDSAAFDERLWYRFNARSRHIDYRDVLRLGLPSIIRAYQPYCVDVFFSDYYFDYEGPSDDLSREYGRLFSDPSVDTDGRSFIYTLHPAQFWDAELCRRALGFDRDEVIRRTRDVAIVAEPVLDGVYLVLNDDPDLTYEAFVEMNERVRPPLGLDQRWAAM